MAGNSIYRPLRNNGHEIRVLRLEPASDSSDNLLKCSLRYILLYNDSAPAAESACVERELKNDSEKNSYVSKNVNKETNGTVPKAQQMHYATKWYKQRERTLNGKMPWDMSPSYIALSYTWGNPQDVVPLQVEGTTLMITRNLNDALIAIRAEPQLSSFSVWADAVCINQDDIKEKNNEVKRMFEVYRRASRVVIWLGSVPTTWNFFGLKTTGDVNKIIPRLLMERSMDLEVIYPGKFTTDEILVTIAILDRPYWTRIWILQELVMADYENTFFFWAQTLRHISDLLHAREFFDNVDVWIRSAEMSSLLDSLPTYENAAIGSRHQTLYSDSNLENPNPEDDETQIAKRVLYSRLAKVDFESDISEGVIEGLRTGKRLDVQGYLQEKLKGRACLNSIEITKMFRSLKELIRLSRSVAIDAHRKMKRTEMKLALNELALTMATMMQAATLDTTKEDVDFRLLMTHSLKGQCTNKSDLVYGLLGLHQHEIASQITPDYDLPIVRVLSDFSAAIIRCRGLNFLCEYETELSYFCDSMPSWVVDPTRERNHASKTGGGEWARKWRKFSAGGVKTDDIRFSIDNAHLHCQGILYKVDTKTPQSKYHNKDLIIQALKRVVSCYTPDEEECHSILNISAQTTSEDVEVANVIAMSEDFWALHSDFAIEGIKFQDLLPQQNDIIEWDLETATNAVHTVLYKKIFTTVDGTLGLATLALRDGDIIAILRGCNIPTILREHQGGYKLIGMCYLDGVMFGEVFEEGVTLEELTVC